MPTFHPDFYGIYCLAFSIAGFFLRGSQSKLMHCQSRLDVLPRHPVWTIGNRLHFQLNFDFMLHNDRFKSWMKLYIGKLPFIINPMSFT